MTRRTEVAEDVEWLLSWGEWPDRIAARVGYRHPQSLADSLRKFGRGDLARQLAEQDRASRAYQLARNTALDDVLVGIRRTSRHKGDSHERMGTAILGESQQNRDVLAVDRDRQPRIRRHQNQRT